MEHSTLDDEAKLNNAVSVEGVSEFTTEESLQKSPAAQTRGWVTRRGFAASTLPGVAVPSDS